MSQQAPSRVVSFAEASAVVRYFADWLAANVPPSAQPVALLESLGRVLAQPLRADRDQPPFPRSTRDGFACQAASLKSGRSLRVVGQLRAGESWPPAGDLRTGAEEISAGQAIEIMTGAPVPAGADCVVMLEHVHHEATSIRLLEDPNIVPGIFPGSNIIPTGAEARAGETIFPAGTRISAAQIAAAASVGAIELSVFAKPRVAIVATGDELVEAGQTPLSYQIRNSNSYALSGQILAAGGDPLQLPIARDTREDLEARIRKAFTADLLLLSGGVSMGKYDLVEEVLLSLGAEFFFTGALIQPGKPVVFGRMPRDGHPLFFFGLPGNPVSTMVTFSLFVDPLLGALCGQPSRGPRFVEAKLMLESRNKAGLTRFLPALLESGLSQSSASLTTPFTATQLRPTVTPIAWQGSGDLAAASRANCFLVVPPDRPILAAGETAVVLL